MASRSGAGVSAAIVFCRSAMCWARSSRCQLLGLHLDHGSRRAFLGELQLVLVPELRQFGFSCDVTLV
jgi:hypothetical protein